MAVENIIREEEKTKRHERAMYVFGGLIFAGLIFFLNKMSHKERMRKLTVKAIEKKIKKQNLNNVTQYG